MVVTSGSAVPPTWGGWLVPGQRQPATIEIAADRPGRLDARVEVFAGGHRQTLPVVAYGGTANFSWAPTAVDFGRVPTGERPRRAVQIQNHGAVPIEILERTVLGSPNFVAVSEDDPDFPFVLGAGQVFIQRIDFVPVRVETSTGSLQLSVRGEDESQRITILLMAEAT